MKKNNNAHLYGYINGILENDFKGKKSYLIDLATMEVFNNNAGEKQKKYTYHNVSLITGNKELIEKLKVAKQDVENNYEHLEEENFKPKTHTASIDGTLVVRVNNAPDGKTYYNSLVIVNEEDFKLDTKLQEGESRNRAEFKGNIAHIDVKDNFAVIRIGTHYFIPGESENFKGEVKPYSEATSYTETRISANRLPKTFEDLKNGNLEVGDLVTVRGQMHNNRYTDSNGASQNKIVIDLNKIDLVAKKGQKKNEAEEKVEKKTEKKAESKKAAPKKAAARKKGVTM